LALITYLSRVTLLPLHRSVSKTILKSSGNRFGGHSGDRVSILGDAKFGSIPSGDIFTFIELSSDD
jgi:hypothetical protein